MYFDNPNCKLKQKIIKDNQSITVYECECGIIWSEEKQNE